MSSIDDTSDHNMQSTTRRAVQLQGPRPAPLMVNKSSPKIKKPHQAPVVIYLNSPKIIHVRQEEFMGIVQRLTGKHAAAAGQQDYESEGNCGDPGVDSRFSIEPSLNEYPSFRIDINGN
ncbi:VQ domain-containing protein [Cephalotus follicularis]|uniref:VQ domain-containing protein n=1 Tax=Cephalotus follicularis TaxID=3775 RepID=A0A1Q3B7J2_CEPFO|nr:VQ domain-containing protein [Cephalotus follicularis]